MVVYVISLARKHDTSILRGVALQLGCKSSVPGSIWQAGGVRPERNNIVVWAKAAHCVFCWHPGHPVSFTDEAWIVLPLLITAPKVLGKGVSQFSTASVKFGRPLSSMEELPGVEPSRYNEVQIPNSCASVWVLFCYNSRPGMQERKGSLRLQHTEERRLSPGMPKCHHVLIHVPPSLFLYLSLYGVYIPYIIFIIRLQCERLEVRLGRGLWEVGLQNLCLSYSNRLDPHNSLISTI